MSDVWYEEVEAATRLTQGDLIDNCPLITWKAEPVQLLYGGEEAESLIGMIEAIQSDVVVMTQTCDLEHEKVSNVVLCPHISLIDYREIWEAEMKKRNQNPTSKAWKN